MNRILMASASPEIEAHIAEATGGNFLPLRLDRLPEQPDALLQLPAGVPLPEVLVLDGVSEPARAVELAARFVDSYPAISVVLMAAEGSELALAALRAGIRDIVDPHADPSDLRNALDRAGEAARRSQPTIDPATVTPLPSTTGHVVTVVSPKGGVGKTTVATNVAVGLARIAPDQTVLVDLDIQFGDVGSSLDLDPEYFLADAVSEQAKHDPMVLKTFLTRHPTGLYVICAPDSPIEADAISGDDVSHLLQMLASEFRYVVVDTAPGLVEHTLSALDRTTDLVLLTSMEVPGVRGLRKELDTLHELQMLPERRHIVLNFAEPHSLLSVADVEAVIGTRVDLQLPRYSKAATMAVNQGIPLLQSGGRDPLTKGLRLLVERLTEAGPVSLAAEPTGFSDPGRIGGKAAKPRHALGRWRRPRLVA